MEVNLPPPLPPIFIEIPQSEVIDNEVIVYKKICFDRLGQLIIVLLLSLLIIGFVIGIIYHIYMNSLD